MHARIFEMCVLAAVMFELATYALALPHGHDYSVCNVTNAGSSSNVQRPNVTNQFHTRIEVVIVNKKKTGTVHEYVDATNNRGYLSKKDQYSSNVQRPNVTNQFHTRIEVVIVNKKKTDTVHEYFDATNNRGYLSKKDQDISYDYWYDYSTNEFILYYPQLAGIPGAPACSVSDLSQSAQRYLFGYEKINGNPHIFSAAGALHFGGMGVEEVYMGPTVIRNINVDWWRSCQYWKSMDATMTVDWHFTSRTTWDATVGIGAQLPVQAHVTGMAYNSTGQGHHFDHYYNFFDFKPYIDDTSVFETPEGVTCPGRKLTKRLPELASDFSFTTEIVDLVKDGVAYMKDSFYYSKKLVKYEYRPHPEDFSPYGTRDLIEIHDFNSGVAYITDAAQGNCSVRAIEVQDFDDRRVGMNKVRLRTSKEFFYFDTKNVVYEGIKKNRGIDCDTWIATRSDFPFFEPTNSTWEWYFATSTWQQLNSGPEAGAIPVQMRITIPTMNWKYEYNTYNFQKSKPDLLKFDISACYQPSTRRKFDLKATATDQVQFQINSYVKLFKHKVLDAIMSYTKISPLRVANLQVILTDTIIVTFELLDVSPIIGSTQRAPNYTEVALDFAANTITQMAQNGQFVIQLTDPPFTNSTLLTLAMITTTTATTTGTETTATETTEAAATITTTTITTATTTSAAAVGNTTTAITAKEARETGSTSGAPVAVVYTLAALVALLGGVAIFATVKYIQHRRRLRNTDYPIPMDNPAYTPS